MNIYNVNPDFINMLRRKYTTIMMPKDDLSSNGGRKYIGIVFEINEFNFFVPISSPSNKNYMNGYGGKLTAKDNTLFTFYVTHKDKLGNNIIDSVLNYGNMLPIPDCELNVYKILDEPNPFFKEKFKRLFRYVKKMNRN